MFTSTKWRKPNQWPGRPGIRSVSNLRGKIQRHGNSEKETKSSVQFSLAAQSCSTLCDPMNHSIPGLPVHHKLPEFTQTHVHWVSDAIQWSHPLWSPSPPAFNVSQHQGLFFSFFHVGKHWFCGNFIFYLFIFFLFIFINWRLITLQYCSGFCHTLTWISHGVTCVPHPNPPPPHLPSHLIPLGLPSAPAPSTWLMWNQKSRGQI